MTRIGSTLVIAWLGAWLAGSGMFAAPQGTADAAGSQAGVGSSVARHVWTGPAFSVGAVSPDGRYFSVGDAQGYLRVRNVASGSERVLSGRETGVPGGFAEDSVFSRDGLQVAYARLRDGDKRYELWAANVSGEANPRLLFANEPQVAPWMSPTDWSADGKMLAVLLLGRNRPDSISLFSIADRSLRELKTINWGGGPIVFSPDGRYVGFTREIVDGNLTQDDVAILATDGSREISVAAHPRRDTFAGWSPDGKTVIFVSNRTGSDALFGIGFADGTVQAAPVLIKPEFPSSDVLGVTPAGALYYIPRRDPVADVQVAPFDVNSGRWMSDPVRVSGAGLNSAPGWSPDGRYLAYLEWPSRVSSGSLAIRSSETGRVRAVRPNGRSSFASYRWSPDGRSLAAYAPRRDGRGFYRVDAESGDVTLMAPAPEGSEADEQVGLAHWSQDGKTVFYSRVIAGNTVTLTARELDSGREREVIRRAGTQNTALVGFSPDGTKLYYRRSLAGSDSRVISGSPGATEYAFIERLVSGADRELIRRSGLGHPNVSPDGRSIATQSRDRSAKTQVVLLIPIAGGEPRELMRVTEPDGINLAAWAPDSRSVVAAKNQAGQPPEMWWIPIDGRTIRRIDLIRGMSPFTVRFHSDGRQVAYVVPGATSEPIRDEVWLLENFLPLAGVTR